MKNEYCNAKKNLFFLQISFFVKSSMALKKFLFDELAFWRHKH